MANKGFPTYNKVKRSIRAASLLNPHRVKSPSGANINSGFGGGSSSSSEGGEVTQDDIDNILAQVSLNINQTLIVDPVNGDDDTAERGTTKPYLTLVAANAASLVQDKILLQPGTHQLGNNLIELKEGVTLEGTSPVSTLVIAAINQSMVSKTVIKGYNQGDSFVKGFQLAVPYENSIIAPPLGIRNASNPGSNSARLFVENMIIDGAADCLYMEGRMTGNNRNIVVCRHTTFKAKWDIFYGHGASDVFLIDNCLGYWEPNGSLAGNTSMQLGGDARYELTNCNFIYLNVVNEDVLTNGRHWGAFINSRKIHFHNVGIQNTSPDLTATMIWGTFNPTDNYLVLTGNNNIDLYDNFSADYFDRVPPKIVCPSSTWIRLTIRPQDLNILGVGVGSLEIPIFHLPRQSMIESAFAFGGGFVCSGGVTLSGQVGISGTAGKYLTAFSLTSAVDKALNNVNVIEDNNADADDSGTLVLLTVTATGGDVGTVTSGSFDIMIKVSGLVPNDYGNYLLGVN